MSRMKRAVAVAGALTTALVGLTPITASAATQAADVTVTLRITIGVGDPSWPADSVNVSVPDASQGSGRRWICYQGFTTDVPKDVTVTVPEGTFLSMWSSHGCYDALRNGTAIATADGAVIEVNVP